MLCKLQWSRENAFHHQCCPMPCNAEISWIWKDWNPDGPSADHVSENQCCVSTPMASGPPPVFLSQTYTVIVFVMPHPEPHWNISQFRLHTMSVDHFSFSLVVHFGMNSIIICKTCFLYFTVVCSLLERSMHTKGFWNYLMYMPLAKPSRSGDWIFCRGCLNKY